MKYSHSIILSFILIGFSTTIDARDYKMESGNTFDLSLKEKDSEFITNNKSLRNISREAAGRATSIEGFLSTPDYEVHFFNELVGYVQAEDCNIDKDLLFAEIQKQTAIQSKEINRIITPLEWVIEPTYNDELDAVYYAFSAQFEDSSAPWINMRVYELGRYGYEQMLVVADPKTFKKINASDLVEYLDTNHAFPEGAKYSDYKPGDNVAPMGTCGLVSSFFGVLEDEDDGIDEVDEVDEGDSDEQLPKINILWLMAFILLTFAGTVIARRRK